MRFLSIARSAIFIATIAPYAGAFAQALTIGDVVNGKFPTTMAPADLPASYRAARIVSAGPVPDPMTAMAPLMFMSYSSSSAGPNVGLMGMVDESWTDGTVVTVEGKAFLVTYKLNLSLADFIRRSGQVGVAGSQEPKQSAPKYSLKLNLVKVDGIQSITPDSELTKEKLLSLLGQGVGQTAGDKTSESALRTETISNMKQVALGMIMYTADSDDVFPWPQGMKAVKYAVYPYLKNEKAWETMNPNGGEVRFNMALGGVSMTSLENPAETVLYYETKEWPNGTRCVAYTDGHVSMASSDRWQVLSKTLLAKYPKTAKRPLPLNYGLTGYK